MKISNRTQVSFKSHYLLNGDDEALGNTLWYLQQKRKQGVDNMDFLTIQMPPDHPEILHPDHLMVFGEDTRYIKNRTQLIVEDIVPHKKKTPENIVKVAKKLLESIASADNSITQGKPITVFTTKAIQHHLAYLDAIEIPKFDASAILERIKSLKPNPTDIEQKIFSRLV